MAKRLRQFVGVQPFLIYTTDMLLIFSYQFVGFPFNKSFRIGVASSTSAFATIADGTFLALLLFLERTNNPIPITIVTLGSGLVSTEISNLAFTSA